MHWPENYLLRVLVVVLILIGFSSLFGLTQFLLWKDPYRAAAAVVAGYAILAVVAQLAAVRDKLKFQISLLASSLITVATLFFCLQTIA